VEGAAEKVRMDIPVVPGESVTWGGFRVSDAPGLLGELTAVKFKTPAKPFRLERLTVAEFEEPTRTDMDWE